MYSKSVRIAVLLCSLTLAGASSGCVSKARYNKLLAENQACQQQSDDQQARLTRVRSLLSETRSGIARAPGQEFGPDTDLTEEQLIADIRQALNDQQMAAVQKPGDLTVQVMAKYLFSSGSASLSAEGQEALMKVASWLQQSESRHIFVEGYTDDVPIGDKLKRKYANNWELSVHRATSVVNFLTSNGVAQDRLVAVGYGEHAPIVENSSPENRELNRRIEIKLHDLDFQEVAARVPGSLNQTAFLDINSANYNDLIILPGVTPEFARAVVEYRSRAGRISSFEDLRQVRGFDEQQLEHMRSMVAFGDTGSVTSGSDTASDYNRSTGTGTDTGTPGTNDSSPSSDVSNTGKQPVANPKEGDTSGQQRTEGWNPPHPLDPGQESEGTQLQRMDNSSNRNSLETDKEAPPR